MNIDVDKGVGRIMYKSGDIVYHISNSIYVRKARVIRAGGGFCTIKFDDTGSGSRVRATKLYKTEKEASEIVDIYKRKYK